MNECTAHRTGTEARTPRQDLHRQIFLLQAENLRLQAENEQLRERLAQYAELDATCEALGIE